MCNYTDRPFRDLLRLMGAYLVYTEMYSSEALVRGDPKTFGLMDYRGEAPPLVVQIFGSRIDLMAESVRVVERLGADAVDLNMGCPAKKITKSGSGAALAENPARARAVVRAMRAATRLPFTVKMRWQLEDKAIEVARMCEDEGVDAVALHARTRAQAYSGSADWRWIARMKEALRIPVIGNGDVRSVVDVARMRAETGCDAVMAGRGIVGNPWLMRDAARLFRGEIAPGDAALEAEDALPDAADRLPVLFEHARLMYQHRGARGLIEFRKHCAGYIRGLPGARQARPELMQTTALEELREILTRHFGAFSV